MAKQGHPSTRKTPTKKKGVTTKDPLGKWGSDPELVAQDSIESIASYQEQISSLATSLARPGLSVPIRRALFEALAQAKLSLREAKVQNAKVLKDYAKNSSIKDEAQLKLKDLKSLIKGNKDPLLAKYAKVTQDLLSQLVKDANKLGNSEKSNEKILQALRDIEASTENLPEEFQKSFEESAAIFEKVNAKRERDQEKRDKEQAKAQEKYKNDYDKARDLLDGYEKERKEKWVNRGMSLADKVGIGGANIGNAIRLRQKYKGWQNKRAEHKAAKGIVAATKGRFTESEDTDVEVDKDRELQTILKDYTGDQRRFNSRALKELSKKKNTGEDVSGVIAKAMGGLGASLGTAMGPVTGALAGLGGVIGKLGMLAGKAGLVGAAGAAGWAVGTKIYDKFGLQIGDGIDKVMDLGSNLMGVKTDRQKVAEMLAPGGKPAPKGTPIPAGLLGEGGLSKKAVPASFGKTGSVTPVKMGAGSASNLSSLAPPANTSDTGGSSQSSVSSTKVNTGQKLPGKGSLAVAGGVDVDGLNPGVKSNLDAMADEYFQLTGKKLPINSAFRSNEKQAQLYKTMPKGMAAPPGSSLHNYGFAFDTNSSTGEELNKLGLLGKYGFDRPIKSEKWHVQPAGLSLAAAKQGLYSADAPNSQAGGSGNGGGNARPAAQAISPAVSPMDKVASASGSPGSPAAGGSASRGSVSAPQANSVKDVPTFDTSDGLLFAMNQGVA